jgi:small subunit ribosomal protein S3
MGNKVNPISFRTGPLFQSRSLWFADKNVYQNQIFEDLKLREFLEKRLENAGVVKIDIERSINKVNIVLSVSRPGVVIGKGGATLKELRQEISKMTGADKVMGQKINVGLEVIQVEQPDLEAKLVAQRISDQLKNRYPHRRAVTQALEKVMQAGAKGVKIQLSGRIAGAEIGRREKYNRGTIPLTTIRKDISYTHVPSLTKSGYVGIKVWINRGEK